MKKIPTWIYVWVSTAVAVGLFLAFRSKKKDKPPKKILFVDDSITATTYQGKPTGTYPLIIGRKRPDLTIDVLAIGGKTTKWMLENLPSKIANGYDRVYIYGGVNDAFSPVNLNSVVSNVQKMVDLANSNGASAYVVLGYEPNGFMEYKKMPTTRYVGTKEGYIPLIARYKELQSKYLSVKDAIFVPKFQLGSNTSDGTHPNGIGQNIIAEDIMKTF